MAHEKGIALQSDFARQKALLVAAGASMGLLSTLTASGFSGRWRPTQQGLRAIFKEMSDE